MSNVPRREVKFAIGDKVRILKDGDGSEGSIATIGNVYKSGRYRVDLQSGGFRNLPEKSLEEAK